MPLTCDSELEQHNPKYLVSAFAFHQINLTPFLRVIWAFVVLLDKIVCIFRDSKV